MQLGDDDDDDCRLVECAVSMYTSCSQCSNVIKETQQKEERPINKYNLDGEGTENR